MSRKYRAFCERVENLNIKSGRNVEITFQENDEEDEVTILWFQRISDVVGSGKEFLKNVCTFADEMNIVLNLSVSVRNANLVEYYSEFGFVQDGPATNTTIYMYRYPKE